MSALFGWAIRNPYRAAVLSGIVLTLILGWVSFPREETISKTVEDWLPENVAGVGTGRTELLEALERHRTGGDAGAVVVSVDEFNDLGLAQAFALPATAEGEREFVIQYVGRGSDNQVYVAERKVAPAPWWSPERWVYKAIDVETDQFGDVLRLTFERDLSALAALFLFDAIVGGIYASIIGMILGVLGSERLDKKHAERPFPKSPPLTPFHSGDIFRA